jgi:hypothetical protein
VLTGIIASFILAISQATVRRWVEGRSVKHGAAEREAG